MRRRLDFPGTASISNNVCHNTNALVAPPARQPQRKEMMMRIAMMSAIAGATLLGAGAATAAPLPAPVNEGAAATIQPAVATGNDAKLVLVRGGCGWGAHRSWHGYCHYNHGWRGHVRVWHHWHRWGPHWHHWYHRW